MLEKIKGGTRGALIFAGITLLFTLFMAIVSINRHNSFVIPGFPLNTFSQGDAVELKVNKITSSITQLPYRYHDLPVCKPKHTHRESENLGEIILGDRIESSLFNVTMLDDDNCHVLCSHHLEPKDIKTFQARIDEEYKVHWQMDSLPAATKYKKSFGTPVNDKGAEYDVDLDPFFYDVGFPLGEIAVKREGDKETRADWYLNNHFDIVIHYNEDTHPTEKDKGEGKKYYIVFFEVRPSSINYTSLDTAEQVKNSCESPTHNVLSVKDHEKAKDIYFTYSVSWKKSHHTWANRWDTYLRMGADGQIHWFSIINSLMIVLFLTGMVAMIMIRTLHADLSRYNASDPEDAEDRGWKKVHEDVFRRPPHSMIFSVLVGSGVQVFCMTIVTMVFAVLGFLSPANRGALMTAVLVLYVWMGAISGYFSTRTYKMFNGTKWKKNTLATAFFFPGVSFAIFFFLNIFLWAKSSSGGVPFGTLCALIALWFGISVPLCFFGSYFAFKKPSPEQPVKTNQIPSQIPAQVWYMHPLFSILMGGILPFGAVFIELFFILSSIWLHQFYYLFPFLFIVFIILVITCAEITIVMCYFQLCARDYRWWWRSYLTSGASAFYMFLYSMFYCSKLHIAGFVPIVLYFGYSIIMCLWFFVLTGTIGYYACYFFVRKIYSSIPLD